jgi:hypothetical protein
LIPEVQSEFMQIIKSTLFNPRKCEYGDFELMPETGWKISQTFIDYESKLLIVSVSIIDQSKWIDNGYNGRTIPTREYKIDLKTLSILQPEQWQKYFNYDKLEIISEDKRYKLISQRMHDPERNSDGYEEELYDLTSNTLISRSSSIAFQKDKRENLLEARYRSIKEREERKQVLAAKPTLEQYYYNQLAGLKNHDAILCYYDSVNVFQLNYEDGKFVLSGSGKLPSDYKEWKSMKFHLVKIYLNLSDFWEEFIATEKWYLRFNYLNGHGRDSSKALVLAKFVIQFFNGLRSRHDFTYAEYGKINNWSNLVWSEEYKGTEIKQWCSNCLKEVYYQARYPKYICSECASKNKYDKLGNLLEFSNLGFSGGFKITYNDASGNTIREDDTQEYCECMIDNKMFFAQEARFGGIVIQKKE